MAGSNVTILGNTLQFSNGTISVDSQFVQFTQNPIVNSKNISIMLQGGTHQFTSNNFSNSSPVLQTGTQDFEFSGNNFQNFPFLEVVLLGSSLESSVTVSKNVVQDVGLGVITIQCTNATVTENSGTFDSAFFLVPSDNGNISGNSFHGASFVLSGQNLTFDGNYLENSHASAVQINATIYAEAGQNQIFNPLLSGISVLSPQASITGNTVQNCSCGTVIYLQGSDGTVSGNQIVGGTFSSGIGIEASPVSIESNFEVTYNEVC